MKQLLTIMLLAISLGSRAQSALVPNGSILEYMAKRFEIKTGILQNDLHTDVAPFNRKNVGPFLNHIFDSTLKSNGPADDFYRNYALNENFNWAGGQWNTQNGLFGKFYKNQNSIYSAKEDGLELFVNPVIHYRLGGETNWPDSQNMFFNERGAEVRGNIGRKLGFYTYFTDNQARYPIYVQNWISQNSVIPGEGFWKKFKETGVDHYSSRGHITWSASKYVDFTFGHGRNFIGNGMRSLLLSDFSRDYLHLRINTRIWKFNYQNLFAEFVNVQPIATPGQRLSTGAYPRKYMASHYLSLDVSKKLSIGLFEAEMFHDADSNGSGFELNYLNPIIFYRAVEHYIGSADNALMAINVNYLPTKGVSLYGQFIIDEFRFYEFISNSGWWGNKHGVQAGLKYIDAFGIKNLDYQFEFNSVRPYTYTHQNGGTNYVHYNQPLAHPLGANFKEVINRIRWVPTRNLFIDVIYNYSIQGLDNDTTNWGANILKSFNEIESETNNFIGQGNRAVVNRFDVNLSYMFYHNLFLDFSVTNRSLVTQTGSLDYSSSFYSVGIRWNAIPKNLLF
ncbi:MAG: hypothetical protein KDC92_02185 [Bacteroidetes bacterium]|nr:hypothetical protein [Bacteroidota bacterium]